MVKLVFTLATLVALLVAGKRVLPAQLNAPIGSFSVAVLFIATRKFQRRIA